MARLPVPGALVIPNCVEIQLIYSWSGRTLKNVMHGSYTGTPALSNAFAETVFAAIKARAETTAWRARLGTGISFTAVGLRDLRSANQAQFLSTGPAVAGTGAGTTVSMNTALVVTLTTNLTGKQNRGRAYLAGMLDAGLSDPRTWSAAYGTDAVAFLSGIASVCSTNSIPLVVAQRALQAGTDHAGNPLPARTANTVAVTGQKIANPRVDSMRTRTGR